MTKNNSKNAILSIFSQYFKEHIRFKITSETKPSAKINKKTIQNASFDKKSKKSIKIIFCVYLDCFRLSPSQWRI